MDFKSIENQALGLAANQRAQLAFELIESLEVATADEVEALWLTEASKRAQQLDQGEATVDAQQVLQRARAMLEAQ